MITDKHFRIYAMDTHFYTPLGVYPFETRCEMLAELGYDATYHTLWINDPISWEDLGKLKDVKRQFGLDVAGVYVVADIAAGKMSDRHQKIARVLETLQGCTTVEIAIRSSDTGIANSSEAGDDSAAEYLADLLAICDRRDLRLLLYPHINHWLERIQDAARLCRKVGHPRLGLVFCGFHWYAIDGSDLATTLRSAAPYLWQANVCGSRRDVDGLAGKATIEPLDSGELDNFAVIGMLQSIGFQGLLGLQGYSIAGDVFAVLRRSLSAVRDIERRLQAHPHWLRLNPQPPA